MPFVIFVGFGAGVQVAVHITVGTPTQPLSKGEWFRFAKRICIKFEVSLYFIIFIAGERLLSICVVYAVLGMQQVAQRHR